MPKFDTRSFVKSITTMVEDKSKAEKSKMDFQNKLLIQNLERRLDERQESKKLKEQHEYKMKEKAAPTFGETQMAGKEQQYEEAAAAPGATPPMPGLPFGGDVSKFIGTQRPTRTGKGMTMKPPDTQAIYAYLQKKKEIAEQNPKIQFDEADQTMLDSISQKLGFAQKPKQKRVRVLGGVIHEEDPETGKWSSTGVGQKTRTGISKETQAAIMQIVDQMNEENDILTKEDAIALLDEQETELRARRVNVDYIRQHFLNVLPDAPPKSEEEKEGFWQSLGKWWAGD